MRIGITGTYSSGKTLTSVALSYYLGLPRTQARTMREILPDAVPGKDLEQCTPAEIINLIVTRHIERVVYEEKLSPSFVSDGCSLQEWIYGSVRVLFGINPNDSIHLNPGEHVPLTPELIFFKDVMGELGKIYKRHVKRSFDVFIHLPNELPLSKDGHRPVNEHFRTSSDELLKGTLEELALPYYIVGGTIEQRLDKISEILNIKPVIPAREAVEKETRIYNELIL
ncbi:Predicted ATPase/kinase involved in NAD metabolism [Yersinia aldovae]|uniref:AAA family ATPase n=1 Tax=Yersinia aldovae TaxID=29483 RepID=UPI0005E26CE6|nr:AAA family ATPase [Yersinia aldovae]CNJ84159.1 Predicted ATPase/kinase involved in NAD metabolism [Yersinia aldovae]